MGQLSAACIAWVARTTQQHANAISTAIGPSPEPIPQVAAARNDVSTAIAAQGTGDARIALSPISKVEVEEEGVNIHNEEHNRAIRGKTPSRCSEARDERSRLHPYLRRISTHYSRGSQEVGAMTTPFVIVKFQWGFGGYTRGSSCFNTTWQAALP